MMKAWGDNHEKRTQFKRFFFRYFTKLKIISRVSKISWGHHYMSSWPPQNGLKDCRRLTLVGGCMLAQPACACPEEAKLGTFGTDRGKDWGGWELQKMPSISWVSHTYMCLLGHHRRSCWQNNICLKVWTFILLICVQKCRLTSTQLASSDWIKVLVCWSQNPRWELHQTTPNAYCSTLSIC